MSKTTWIWILVILVLIIAGILIYRAENNNTSEGATATTTASGDTTNSSSGIAGMKSTLGGIFDAPGSYECDYNQVATSTRSTNVVYVSKGKLRAEFRTTTATGTIASMSVYDGNNLYVWTEGESTGKVSQPKTIADLPAAIPQDITSGRILGTSANNVSWDCHAWSPDLTKLVKPSYVTFK